MSCHVQTHLMLLCEIFECLVHVESYVSILFVASLQQNINRCIFLKEELSINPLTCCYVFAKANFYT